MASVRVAAHTVVLVRVAACRRSGKPDYRRTDANRDHPFSTRAKSLMGPGACTEEEFGQERSARSVECEGIFWSGVSVSGRFRPRSGLLQTHMPELATDLRYTGASSGRAFQCSVKRHLAAVAIGDGAQAAKPAKAELPLYVSTCRARHARCGWYSESHGLGSQAEHQGGNTHHHGPTRQHGFACSRIGFAAPSTAQAADRH